MEEYSVKNPNWVVPKFRLDYWQEKKTSYLVVIPVINEGERILSLLSKMAEIEVSRIADILIVDGGSTDGSLNLKILKKLNVNGLITKLGPGKLSAQLRCGYAFGLDQTYEGIITIDGNDKDDPTPIAEFVSALNNGYDFVQASRFIEGGEAQNTPKSRDLAIRYIHAPLLSYFSGFKWTDTTQGFRAYSSRMLLDSRVAPFRNVFESYELLAYLSYIVPRLGYKCIEIPTARRYPKGEVPTKISGFRGNLSLLKILVSTCLGYYSPDQD